MPAQPSSALQYNLTQDYLELARAALTQIHGKVPAGEDQSVPPLSNELANAIFSVVSITIVYSFLALESFLNYQLFRLWTRRADGSEESNRFLSELGDVSEFIRLKSNDKVREVPARLKTVCRLLAYPPPHEAIPGAWQRLNDLVEASRHFVVHPFPDADYLALMRPLIAAIATLSFSALAFTQPIIPAQVTSVVTDGYWRRGRRARE